MKVTLLEYSGSGWPDPADRAATVMIFTKQTRLQMNPGLLDEITAWPREKKLAELEYMANTIPSSWEFCDYIFMVEGVTRAFTHQFVRSRQFSFAQQTMRVLNVEGWDYGTGPSISDNPVLKADYDATMDYIADSYDSLIRNGAKIEDARGVLPTNILTNIVGKCNMRTLVELSHKRSSPRTQDEYQLVLEQVKLRALEVHPWLQLFIDRNVDRVIADLQAQFKQLLDQGLSVERHTHLTKLLDQLRAQV